MQPVTIRIVRAERKRVMTIGVTIVVVSIVLFVCNPLPHPLSTDPDEARHKLAEIVPSGTSVAEAERRMKELGWTCETARNQSFSDERKPMGQWQHYAGISFLRCSMTKEGLIGFPQRLWVVALPFDQDERVTNALVHQWNRSLVVP